jgi:hypothetical protein
LPEEYEKQLKLKDSQISKLTHEAEQLQKDLTQRKQKEKELDSKLQTSEKEKKEAQDLASKHFISLQQINNERNSSGGPSLFPPFSSSILFACFRVLPILSFFLLFSFPSSLSRGRRSAEEDDEGHLRPARSVDAERGSFRSSSLLPCCFAHPPFFSNDPEPTTEGLGSEQARVGQIFRQNQRTDVSPPTLPATFPFLRLILIYLPFVPPFLRHLFTC